MSMLLRRYHDEDKPKSGAKKPASADKPKSGK